MKHILTQLDSAAAPKWPGALALAALIALAPYSTQAAHHEAKESETHSESGEAAGHHGDEHEGEHHHASAESEGHDGDSHVAASAEEAMPLEVGDHAPDAELLDVDGNPVKLSDLYAKGTSVVVFYRGGWCPYCTKHLADLATIEKELSKTGVQLIAISVDKPELLKKVQEESGLPYTLLSDQDAKAIQAFGLAFRVDQELVDKYKNEYSIDLEGSADRDHHILPVPAAYVVASGGKITYANANADYKSRVAAKELLGKAQWTQEGEGAEDFTETRKPKATSRPAAAKKRATSRPTSRPK